MFGSSHSACFVDEEINIAAGRGSTLFRNLIFGPNGEFNLKESTDEFNKEIFLHSMKDSSNNLNDYDYFILNVNMKIDLPILLRTKKKNSHKSILGISKSLFLEILNGKLQNLNWNYKIHKDFHDNLIQKGINKQQIIILLKPFFSLPAEIEVEENNEVITNKVTSFLYLLDKEVEKKLNRVVLPDFGMLTNGFFIKEEFSSNFRNWQNEITNIDKDTIQYSYSHKNKNYAHIMMRKILKIIETDKNS